MPAPTTSAIPITGRHVRNLAEDEISEDQCEDDDGIAEWRNHGDLDVAEGHHDRQIGEGHKHGCRHQIAGLRHEERLPGVGAHESDHESGKSHSHRRRGRDHRRRDFPTDPAGDEIADRHQECR